MTGILTFGAMYNRYLIDVEAGMAYRYIKAKMTARGVSLP